MPEGTIVVDETESTSCDFVFEGGVEVVNSHLDHVPTKILEIIGDKGDTMEAEKRS